MAQAHREMTLSLGKITYRMPNIVEVMRLLGQLGFNRDLKAPPEGQEFMMVARLIEHLEPMIVSIDAKKGETPISTWADALEHIEFMVPLSRIAGEVMSHLKPSPEATERKND